jgi:hypothetical protein
MTQFIFLSQLEMKSNHHDNKTLLFPMHLVSFMVIAFHFFGFNFQNLNFTRRTRMKWTDAPSIRTVRK